MQTRKSRILARSRSHTHTSLVSPFTDINTKALCLGKKIETSSIFESWGTLLVINLATPGVKLIY